MSTVERVRFRLRNGGTPVPFPETKLWLDQRRRCIRQCGLFPIVIDTFFNGTPAYKTSVREICKPQGA
jgi:hypothetical protein